jgi:hypothetical protein
VRKKSGAHLSQDQQRGQRGRDVHRRHDTLQFSLRLQPSPPRERDRKTERPERSAAALGRRVDQLDETYPSHRRSGGVAVDERRLEALDQSEASATSWSAAALASSPAERRGDVGQDRLNDMRIVGDAKLVRDGQE